MIYVYTIAEFVASYFELALLFAFYDLFVPQRLSGLKFQLLRQVMIGGILFLFALVSKLELSPYISLLFAIFSISLISLLFYRGKFVSLEKPSLFAVTSIYFTVMAFIEFVCISIIGIISAENMSAMQYLFEPNMTRVFYLIIEKSTCLVIYFIVKYRLHKIKVNMKYIFVLCFVYAIMLTASFFTINVLAARSSEYDKAMLAIVSIIFVLIALFCFYFIYKLTIMQEQRERLGLIQIRNELLEQNLLDAQKTYTERRQIAHDIKNHLNVLYDLAIAEKNNEISDYLKELVSPFQDIMMIERTGSDFLDTILTIKKREALEHNIVMDIDAKVSTPLNIEPIDLSAIFTNLIDNAIEACDKINEPEQRFIDVVIKHQNNFLMIKVENAALKISLDENKKLITTKKNKSLHGIGLESVRASVEKYNGDISFNYDDEKFVVSIVLCL